jgi:hypothetical protein
LSLDTDKLSAELQRYCVLRLGRIFFCLLELLVLNHADAWQLQDGGSEQKNGKKGHGIKYFLYFCFYCGVYPAAVRLPKCTLEPL